MESYTGCFGARSYDRSFDCFENRVNIYQSLLQMFRYLEKQHTGLGKHPNYIKGADRSRWGETFGILHFAGKVRPAAQLCCVSWSSLGSQFSLTTPCHVRDGLA